MAPSSGADTFDVVFCDTCIGGSSVAAKLARPGAGLRGFYLADYAVNPLGTRTDGEVRTALNRWTDIAAERSSTLVVACNTASVRLEDSPDVRRRAEALGLRLHSMVDLLDAVTPAGAERRVLARRVEARAAQRALLSRAAHDADPGARRWSAERARDLTRACRALILTGG